MVERIYRIPKANKSRKFSQKRIGSATINCKRTLFKILAWKNKSFTRMVMQKFQFSVIDALFEWRWTAEKYKEMSLYNHIKILTRRIKYGLNI